MSDLRTFTLWARALLTQEAGDLLQQVYRLDVQTGARLPIPQGHLMERSIEGQTFRKRIEKLLEDEVDAGLKRDEAVAKLACLLKAIEMAGMQDVETAIGDDQFPATGAHGRPPLWQFVPRNDFFT